jgi:hypothetical protein
MHLRNDIWLGPAVARLLVVAFSPLCAAALAQDARELCPTRPGLGTPPCIVDQHRALAEVGIADWEREQDGSARSEMLVLGEVLLRYGLGVRSEVQIGWTSFGHLRERRGELRTDESGTGDVTITFKRSVKNPDGTGLSVALQPYATVPVGRSPIGAGIVTGGILVPISQDLAHGFQLQLTPQLDMTADDDGGGRHLVYGSVVGLGVDLGGSVSAAVEFSAFCDEAPGAHMSELLGALAFAWQPRGDLQLDLGGVVGLNRSSPDLRLYLGFARRF